MRHHRKIKPFSQLSRRRQRDAYIDVCNQVRRAAPVLGGKFTTHSYIHGGNNWVDILFPGRKTPVFYNAVLRTIRLAYVEAVNDLAWKQLQALAPDREPDFLDCFVKDLKTGYSTWTPGEPVLYPELDNLSQQDWLQCQIPVIADARSVEVFEDWTLHHDYGYGVGLHVTLDVPCLTIDAINRFVERFLVNEADFHDPTPHSYLHAEIPYWGPESNAVLDPWDYPVAGRKPDDG